MLENEISQIKKFPLKKLAFKKDLGLLTFDEAYKYFEELLKLFIELIDLDYENKLTPNEVNSINNYGKSFINGHLNRLATFNINIDNPKQIHDNITTEIKNFYNAIGKELRQAKNDLHIESLLQSQNAVDLQKVQKEVVASKKEYEKIINDLTPKMNDLTSKIKEFESKKAEAENKQGEVSATILAKRFESQSAEHKTNAEIWLRRRSIFFWSIIIILALNFIGYFIIFLGFKLEWFKLETNKFFTIEYGLIKLALLSVLSYGLAFCSKNYRIESNLKSVNTHRRNVAQTLDDFLSANPDADTKSQMIKQGTEAMFKHLPLGYISNEDCRDVGPVNEIIYGITDSVKKKLNN